MEITARRLRRGLGAVFAASAVGGVATFALTAPTTATAAQDPCAASSVAKTIGGVATSMGYYLDAHPQTNQALTSISQQQSGPQSLAAVKSYFDANPQAAKDMQQLQSPLQSLSSQCSLPLTLPQMLGLMQQAQTQAPALPGSAPAQTAPAPAGPGGTGPLPGPSAVSYR